ncbi:hypothetical protein GNP81_08030 [Aliivibrio fischeri]|uniref:Uncharacterized protein n=2 Tax=Aliivibrio fischeri TaxID=668 RepID=A0A844NYU1_ALIFS|nr:MULTISPECIES: hypothetical protein [Aliivibrio]EHN70626.1 hypothetical protein VFSR5_1028 [Aliivibrio fischeri SR5]MBD1568054.1 hypothetical protein [Aliivibrio sp. S10_S31]MUH95308.1 hypothetical protein [Aliivibrio fischeri]MUI65536.1 hypothetical protein [Aliivibrio fischeri]MUJ22959.1 hypothetical protein [Aliivibrio fischeri]
MADIFVWLGVVVFLVGGALLVLEAFSQSIVWGLLCIIFNPIAIVFCSMHWKDAKYPFAIQSIGLFITLLSLSLQSNY